MHGAEFSNILYILIQKLKFEINNALGAALYFQAPTS